MTIHDLSLGRMPEGHSLEWRMYYRFLVPRLARSASEVITHTEATRNEVIQAFGIPAQRVTAVPSGVDERFFAAEPRDRAASPAAPLLVFPSAPIGRKNLDLVLRVLAAAKAPAALSHARLEITGATSSDFPRYNRRIAASGLEGRVRWLGRLPFEELRAAYARADVVVYPSFLEGFGFPPLEAMAVGTPVVAANTSCLPEVLGDAALLVDPTDDASFAAAVESVLTHHDLRQKLVEAGYARSRTFTWARCAEMTAAVYRRAVRSKTA